MKKLIAFVLILVTLAIAFASCAGENGVSLHYLNYTALLKKKTLI